MLIIRLSRVGRKNDPSFRIVLQEKHRTPTGKVIELLGFYNARLKQKSFKEDRIKYWLSQGAQESDTVHNLLVEAKLVDGPKRKASTIKKKTKEEKLKEVSKEVVVEKESETTKEKPATDKDSVTQKTEDVPEDKTKKKTKEVKDQ